MVKSGFKKLLAKWANKIWIIHKITIAMLAITMRFFGIIPIKLTKRTIPAINWMMAVNTMEAINFDAIPWYQTSY